MKKDIFQTEFCALRSADLNFDKQKCTKLNKEKSKITTIVNSRCYTFTIKSSVTAINSTGSQSITLPVGYQVATDQSTIGVNNPNRMLFKYYRTSSNGTWKEFFPNNTKTYGFVDLGFAIGSMPKTRPVY